MKKYNELKDWQKKYIIHNSIGIGIIIITAFTYYFANINNPTPFRSYCIGVGSGVIFVGVAKLLFRTQINGSLIEKED